MTHESTWTVSDEKIREELRLRSRRTGITAETEIRNAFVVLLVLSHSPRLGEGWLDHMNDLFNEAVTEMDRLRG